MAQTHYKQQINAFAQSLRQEEPNPFAKRNELRAPLKTTCATCGPSPPGWAAES